MRTAWGLLLALGVLGAPPLVHAQGPAKPPRVGIIHLSGHHQVMVEGLRQGLRELQLEEGKHFVLDIREVGGDLATVGDQARKLERDGVALIYTVNSQVTLAVKDATERTPIVFYVGANPVGLGLVNSLAKPGGRFTGVHGQSREVTAKRLAVLKQLVPKLHRVITVYRPADNVASDNARVAREAARQLGVQIVERHVNSADELRKELQALKAREADAYFHTPSALSTSLAPAIIDAARARKLPTMFHEQSLVAKGALAAYGHNYPEIGRLSAKYVQRILAGSHPKDLPVENYDKVGFAVNLRVARELGITIPPALRSQVDQFVQ